MQAYCKTCQCGHYRLNNTKYKANVKVRKAKVTARYREIVNEAKGKPCIDCQKMFPPYGMDFDHVNGVKESTIARMWRMGGSEEKLRKEIEKCEVVCAVCHRIRTYERLHASEEIFRLTPVSPLTSNQMKG